jgi:rhodanese-related sulfurtransferase
MSKTFKEMIDEAKSRIVEVTAEDVLARVEKREPFVLVDVREDREWAQGHLPGALHLGRGVLERDAPELLPEKGVPIVLYCAGGARSALAADVLQQLGYTRVESMIGGYSTWKELGLSLEGEP